MRVKLSRISEAPKARRSKAQGEELAVAGSDTLGTEGDVREPCNAWHSRIVPPLQGSFLPRPNPGLRPLCGLRPGLCWAALSALTLRSLSLTLMPRTAGLRLLL